VLGGPATFNLVWTTAKFRQQNPKVYAAFLKALEQSIAMINKDKKWASELYLRPSKNKSSVDAILKILDDPKVAFTTTPQNVMKYVDFMYKTKSIDIMPKSWKDLFFPEVQNQSGS
jgi:NitT/TauT family transport system substrate-binding protein